MIDTKALERGDIIIIEHHNPNTGSINPYHSMIYAPNPNYVGDVIHMGCGFKRSGAIRSTLAQTVRLHNMLNDTGNKFNYETPNQTKIHVYRIRSGIGEAIAQQAEFWMLQGVLYDEKRLVDTVENNARHYDTSIDAQTVNAFEYLKYAARRETAPIKTPLFPHSVSSISSGFGGFCMAPSLNLPNSVTEFGYKIIKSGTDYAERPKGFSCAGFILACVGATLLREEIQPIRAELGWVSLKYGKGPQNGHTPYAHSWNKVQERISIQEKTEIPGLSSLLDEKTFDLKRILKKLSFLAYLHPHHPSVKAFYEGINQAEDWKYIGNIDITSLAISFNKKNYENEKSLDLAQIRQNHQSFGKSYPQAFRKEYKRSFFTHRFLPVLVGEEVSDIRENKEQDSLSCGSILLLLAATAVPLAGWGYLFYKLFETIENSFYSEPTIRQIL
jgi:hypothetical protein